MNEESYCLAASGHACYSKGNDIVCAAVSALCGALSAALYEKSEKLSSLYIREEKGYMRAEAVGKNAKDIFETVISGLQLIEKSYGGYVKITE